jgi:drug/metabolite transporter superfamily protein YnfA
VLVTVQPHATRPLSHLTGCLGFWLWALVGAGLVFGAISFVIFFLIPPVVGVVLLTRRSRWREGPALLGLVAGAGVPLLVVAGLQWNAWHDRVVGDNTPNPFYWGGVGLCLLTAGVVAYAVRSRRGP